MKSKIQSKFWKNIKEILTFNIKKKKTGFKTLRTSNILYTYVNQSTLLKNEF